MSVSTGVNPDLPNPCASALGQTPPERAVLAHLLDQHPRRLTLAELGAELSGAALGPSVVQRAVENLAAADFVRREGLELIATPAVVSFDRRTLQPA